MPSLHNFSYHIEILTQKCESSSAGRASRCQREGREFESRLSLKKGPINGAFYVY